MGKLYVQKFPEVLAYDSGSVGSGCTLTGSFLCSGYSQIVGFLTSSGSLNSSSGLRIHQSVNKGTDWDYLSASQVSATGFSASYMVDIFGDAVRVQFINGGTTAASLRMLFQLKPVAGTAKMSDVVISSGSIVVTNVDSITSGSVDIAGALPAGENHIGEIGGNSDVIDIALTLSTDPYADGNVMADMQEVSGAMRINGGAGAIHSIQLLDKDDNGGNLDLVFAKTAISLGTEASAVSISDASAAEILGIVSVASGDYADLIGSQIVTKTKVGLLVESASDSTSIWMGAISRDTKTHTSNGITTKIGFLRD